MSGTSIIAQIFRSLISFIKLKVIIFQYCFNALVNEVFLKIACGLILDIYLASIQLLQDQVNEKCLCINL